ncbi:MFS transporter [Agrobacterium rhizogenes]|nr:MFS transporter [Rhizobium rhizogenes]NTH62020.1 MFS transporter [Rhizobium rhizogenes]NTH93646.1 MFS transporter [Rhizobium rhizogenes]
MNNNKWTVLVGCLVALTFSFAPVYLFTLGVFSKSMIDEFGWSRMQISAGFSVAQFSVGLFSLFAGVAVDRIGNRRVILFAAVVLPILLAAYGLISSFALYVTLAFLLGGVGSASNPPAVLSLLPRWFDRNLGLSLSIASLGIGIGGTVMPMAAGFANAHLGWRGGFAAIGAVVAVVGILNAVFLVRDKPAKAEAALLGTFATAQETGLNFSACVARYDYWLIVVAFTLIGAVYWGTTSQFGPIMSDRGLSPLETASALSAMGISVIVGRALGGVLLDRISGYIIGFVFFVSASVGAMLLMVSSLNGSPYIAAILLGLALGGEGDVMAYLLRRRYGQKSYGKIFGLCFGVFNFGGLLGPLILGKAFDLAHSYDQVGLAFGVGGVVAAIMLLIISGSHESSRSWDQQDIRTSV